MFNITFDLHKIKMFVHVSEKYYDFYCGQFVIMTMAQVIAVRYIIVILCKDG